MDKITAQQIVLMTDSLAIKLANAEGWVLNGRPHEHLDGPKSKMRRFWRLASVAVRELLGHDPDRATEALR